jgi:hypothetical protein
MFTKNDEYWAKLLMAWYKLGRTGLSIPFLVGSRTISDHSFKPSAIDAKEMLTAIFENGINDHIIRISWCSETRAYVIGVAGEDYNDGIFLATPAKIYAIDILCREFGSSPEEIAEGLSDLYADEILNGNYSVTRGNWRSYDAYDKHYITGCLSN